MKARRRPRSTFLAVAAAIAATSSGLGSELAAAPSFLWPADGRIIAHPCGDPREANVDGLDMAVAPGAEIHAAEGGFVAYAGNELKSYGNLILVRHAGEWVSAYAHLGTMRVKRGDRVERGETIATAVAADSPDPAPFHFELRWHAKPVDPRRHLVFGAAARVIRAGCSG